MPRLSSSSSCAVAVAAALAWIATAPASAWAKLNSYTITYNYVALDSQYAYAFTQSKAKWESVITGTNSDLTVRFDTASPVLCAGESDSKVPAGTAWDDILVFVKVVDIDGPGNAQNGNILGQSFICRYDSQRPSMPRVGWIELDRYDVNQLHLQGQLVSVVTHEMGHLLGIGSSWTNFKLIKPRKFSYFGASGNAGNVQVGFKGKAVIENRGGPGTARSHWSEAQYKNELMTGYISGSTQPMSKLTVLSLVDMGFKVDASKADAYSKSTANLRGSVPEGEAAARAERKPFHARHTSKEIEPLPLDEDVLVKGE